MTVFDTNRASMAHNFSRATGVFGTVFAMLADWNDRRATRKALAVLTDRELDDIGLSRSDIEALSR